jgi:hypothetical protein
MRVHGLVCLQLLEDAINRSQIDDMVTALRKALLLALPVSRQR